MLIVIGSPCPLQKFISVDLVSHILSAKKQNPKADTSDLENKINELIYKIYDLTEEEVAIVERM